MATEVYTTEDIKLRDGKEVTLVPLAIFNLRKFMRIWGEYVQHVQNNMELPEDEQESELDLGDRQFDVFLDLCVLSLSEALQGDKSDEEFRTYIEKTLDEQTIYKVLDRCGGLKLNDPNLQAAALAMSQTAGTN